MNDQLILCHSLDDNYVTQTCVTMMTIKLNKKQETKILTYILHNSLSEESINKIKSLEDKANQYFVEFIDVGSDFDKAYTTEKLPAATYFRLKIHKLLPQYDKVLYLDGDMVITTDLSELYNQDISDVYMAAVQSPGANGKRVLITPEGKRVAVLDYLEDLGMTKTTAPDYYINAGVSLLNTKKIREDNIEEKFFNIINRATFLSAADQDVINPIFDTKKKILSLKWNYQTTLIHDIKNEELKEWFEQHPDYRNDIDRYSTELPAIIHYCYYKPWSNPAQFLSNIWWSYARNTPFYEEILFDNLKPKEKSNIQIKKISKLKKLKYKILSKITFGKARKKYKEKYKRVEVSK